MRFALIYTKWSSANVELYDTIEGALDASEKHDLPRRTYGEEWGIFGLMPRAEHFLSAAGQHLVKYEPVPFVKADDEEEVA